jgi:Fur family ferric uptake transcriptional regulator
MVAPDTAAALLAGDGRRITSPRRLVVEAMTQTKRPFTIEELAAALPGVGRATVFRTVRLLVDNNVVCRVVIEDGTVRYQLSSSTTHHHHLVCSQCGNVEEFVDEKVDKLIESNASTRGFRLASHAMELYGLCATCAAVPS